jgi:glucose-1-phosphate thymidylyltransferase
VEVILEKIGEVPTVEAVLLVTNARFAGHFEDWKRGFRWDREIQVLNDGTTSNENRLGAVGDIYFALREKGIDEEVLVVGGDNLFEFDLRKAWASFEDKGSSVVGLYDMGDRDKVAGLYGVVSIDEASRIVGFEEKPKHPKSALISTALYFLARQDVETLKGYIEEGNSPDNLGDFIRYLIKRQNVFGYVFRENWFDIGSHEQYEQANAYFSKTG